MSVSQVPVVYPLIDYSDVLNYPAFGGGFSFKTNFVNLSRDAPVFDRSTPAIDHAIQIRNDPSIGGHLM
ncbi:hypothetical protein P0R31_05490 [Bradyrhizobium yuanmingense]|uniref:hypothetical protein n=1 Tax=Bradyrhizobium yuanmingense TaxID=108015 RepID=UPI0023B95DFF|nr:hypothetical protein [Bradyrhizobium yuanmingense]MDF0516688.1 hypothetical protein [Bradyrhizobium yuanmingense]